MLDLDIIEIEARGRCPYPGVGHCVGRDAIPTPSRSRCTQRPRRQEASGSFPQPKTKEKRMDPAVMTSQEFEQQLVEALKSLGYRDIRPVPASEGMHSLHAERDTPLGTESLYVACDYWNKDEVQGDQVAQIARSAESPGTRLVLVTTGRFSDDARMMGRELGINLLGGDQLRTLISAAHNGAQTTDAFQAAQIAPQTAPETAAAPPAAPAPASAAPAAPETKSEKNEKVRAARRTRKAGTQRSLPAVAVPKPALAPGVLLFIFGVLAVVVVLAMVLNTGLGLSDESVAAGTSVSVYPAVSNGRVVRVVGQTTPLTDLQLYRNEEPLDRTRSNESGSFEYPFVPLAPGNNDLAIFAVDTSSGQEVRGAELWRRTRVTPFSLDRTSAVWPDQPPQAQHGAGPLRLAAHPSP